MQYGHGRHLQLNYKQHCTKWPMDIIDNRIACFNQNALTSEHLSWLYDAWANAILFYVVFDFRTFKYTVYSTIPYKILSQKTKRVGRTL